MNADVKSKDLKDFISKAIEGVKSGVNEQDYAIAGPIEFELAIVKTKKKGIGFSIHVVDASAKYGKDLVSKIKFVVAPKGSKIERAFR